jgi:hypothetical protein
MPYLKRPGTPVLWYEVDDLHRSLEAGAGDRAAARVRPFVGALVLLGCLISRYYRHSALGTHLPDQLRKEPILGTNGTRIE